MLCISRTIFSFFGLFLALCDLCTGVTYERFLPINTPAEIVIIKMIRRPLIFVIFSPVFEVIYPYVVLIADMIITSPTSRNIYTYCHTLIRKPLQI